VSLCRKNVVLRVEYFLCVCGTGSTVIVEQCSAVVTTRTRDTTQYSMLTNDVIVRVLQIGGPLAAAASPGDSDN
jgi:hypothetical protein